MSKEFEAVKRMFSEQQDNRSQNEILNSIILGQKKEEFLNLAQKRALTNKRKFESLGVKELFEEIKSKNLLSSEVSFMESVSSTNQEFLEDLAQNRAEDFISKPKSNIDFMYGKVDEHMYVSLEWDYEHVYGGAENDYDISKRVKIGVKESELYLTYSGMRGDPIKIRENNLLQVVASALSNAKATHT